MFIGHCGAAFFLKKYDKKISLGNLFLMATLPDTIMAVLVLIGIEKFNIVKGITKANPLDLYYYPFSHGLVSNLVLALVVFFLFKAFYHSTRSGLIGATAVFSHFVLDFVTHRPDLPLLWDGIKIGLGLWNSLFWSYFIEALIFLTGLAIYFSVMKELPKGKKIGMGIMALILLVFFFMGLSGAVPPSPDFMASFNLVMAAVLIGLTTWLDKIKSA
jgi:membrane-bound metal-dependent hydrolase YbcI (DUF457 family)